jgi:hypothetical protein
MWSVAAGGAIAPGVARMAVERGLLLGSMVSRAQFPLVETTFRRFGGGR